MTRMFTDKGGAQSEAEGRIDLLLVNPSRNQTEKIKSKAMERGSNLKNPDKDGSSQLKQSAFYCRIP